MKDKMPKYQKISITGASGFIGRNLLKILNERGYAISVLDFDDTGTYPNGINVVKGDLLIGEGIDEFLDGSDVLVHLAGQVLPGKTSMEEGNVKMTESLVSKLGGHSVKKIVFSSTVAVYGSSTNRVFRESDECHPDTEYGSSKLKAEKIIKDWGKKNGNQYAILRFFSIYGSGNKKGVVFNLCNDFINKGEVRIYGDGSQKRDLVYVEDAARALALTVSRNLEGIYNVGTGKNYSILDLVSMLEKISGKKCKIVFKKQDKSKVGGIFFSVEKFKKKIEWLPKTRIEAGVKLVYESLISNEN